MKGGKTMANCRKTKDGRGTERDRFEALKSVLDVCNENQDVLVSRDSAMNFYNQIKSFKNPKFREELFGKLEIYIGLCYDDELGAWKPYRLVE